jgi:hypothetical protein
VLGGTIHCSINDLSTFFRISSESTIRVSDATVLGCGTLFGMIRRFNNLRRGYALAALLGALWAAWSAHETPTTTLIDLIKTISHGMKLRQVDFGAAHTPLLRSYAAGTADGRWILLSGRSSGVHVLGQSGEPTFPQSSLNGDVWGIDPVATPHRRRSYGDVSTGVNGPVSSLSPWPIVSLSVADERFPQAGDRLYFCGGYGLGIANQSRTCDKFASSNSPRMLNWGVIGGKFSKMTTTFGQAASKHAMSVALTSSTRSNNHCLCEQNVGAAVELLSVCLGGSQNGAIDSDAPSIGTDYELRLAQGSSTLAVESTCLA